MNKPFLGRFMAIMAAIFFVATLVCAWRVSTVDGEDIWYVPLVLACSSALMTVGALRLRRKSRTSKQD